MLCLISSLINDIDNYRFVVELYRTLHRNYSINFLPSPQRTGFFKMNLFIFLPDNSDCPKHVEIKWTSMLLSRVQTCANKMFQIHIHVDIRLRDGWYFLDVLGVAIISSAACWNASWWEFTLAYLRFKVTHILS